MPVWCAETVAICSVRGAYEYAGQKCSATARMYVPESLWPEVSGGRGGGRREKGRREGGERRGEGREEREGEKGGRRGKGRREGGEEGEKGGREVRKK